MIKRFSEISNIGNFYESKTSGQCQFDRLTLIYRLNTYGKSTLVDILDSMSKNDPSIIINRRSIGSECTGLPKVKLTINDDEQDNKERNIIFSYSAWQGFDNNYK